MNNSILNSNVQKFIAENLDSDTSKLLLKGSPFDAISIKDIVQQIEAKKKSRTKLPTWYNTDKIYYPNKLNIEQTSSEVTAKYKAQLIQGNSVFDMTGGFGIDSYYFSNRFETVFHCEISDELSRIVSHNYKQLKKSNIYTLAADGLDYLKKESTTYDWLYIDPSRRHEKKGKVFFLKDCLPNVPEVLDDICQYSNNILIKTSPLLDISVGLDELKYVKEIHIVAIKNDVKELLWLLEKGFNKNVQIRTVNIKDDTQQRFDFVLENESDSAVTYSQPQKFLYEPNSAIMKSGGFKTIASKLELFKLNVNSHLYTSNVLKEFPGRCFEITKMLPYKKRLLKKESLYSANIAMRNFPETVQQIRNKFKIKEGGDTYLFFTTDNSNQKVVLFCKKLA